MTTMTRNHTIEYMLDGLPELTLTNHRGDIHVHHDGGPGEVRITLTSRQPVDFDAVESGADGNRVTVTVPRLQSDGSPGISFNLGPLSWALGGGGATVDADVHLAPEARVSLETHLGDIVIQGRAGRTAAKTGAGDIVADTCESAVMTTGTGDIRLPHVGSATLNTGAGDISVDDCSGRVEIRTGTGDVHVGSSKGQLVVVSGAGDVHAVLAAGSAEIRTGMGDLTIEVPQRRGRLAGPDDRHGRRAQHSAVPRGAGARRAVREHHCPQRGRGRVGRAGRQLLVNDHAPLEPTDRGPRNLCSAGPCPFA